jgi:hypothetical protein
LSDAIDPNDFLMGSGIRSAKFEKAGDTMTGFIVRQPELRDQTDINTGEVKVWADGRPRKQMRVVLEIPIAERDPDDPDDTGERALYVRGNMQKAVADAVRAAGLKGLAIGGKLQITYTGDGESKQRGMNPPKLFTARYRGPEQEPVPVPEEPAPVATPAATTPDLSEVPF